ncbi:MAG TPA: RNA polymerase sigma factor [Planctomycetaceae bacterium]|nr:RNA polymerase sigma factor [Planctomycetaceae bacterium]
MDWKTILERDGPAAWRAAYRIIGQAADADDCLQEAALAAVQLSRREPVGNWRALLTRLAAARAVDRLRQRSRSRISAAFDEQSATITDSHEPVSNAQLAELHSQLRFALGQISQDQATAFCLCALEGWTHAEAGQQLDTPSSTIGVLVHRARQRLRELMPSVAPPLTPSRSHS